MISADPVVLSVAARHGWAHADPAGMHWGTRWHGEVHLAWAEIDWIELGNDQPGGRFFGALGMNEDNLRTGDLKSITVVSNRRPEYVRPFWKARWRKQISFAEELAAYARARGTRVRVLDGDWGRENTNREPSRIWPN